MFGDIIYCITYSTRIIAPDQLGHALNNVSRRNNNKNNNNKNKINNRTENRKRTEKRFSKWKSGGGVVQIYEVHII